MRGRFAQVYTPGKTRAAEADFKKLLRLQWRGKPLAGPIVLSAVFLYKRPKRTKLKHPKDDIDNTLKWLMDSCNGILWQDDKQVYALGEVSKQFASESRVIFTVEER